jgi:two-component system response regulator AtoC
MERATLMARGDLLLPEHLPKRVQQAVGAAEEGERKGVSMEEMERSLILQTLREHGFNRTETARALGISRRALTYKIRDLREQGYMVDPK